MSSLDLSVFQNSRTEYYPRIVEQKKDYMINFKEKLHYVQKLLSHPRNHTQDMCISVFLTHFTLPVWLTVSCSKMFNRTYFLCEDVVEDSSSPPTRHVYERNKTSCNYQAVFIKNVCYKIKAYAHAQSFNVFSLDPYVLSAMLSHWSLGHKSRHKLLIHSNISHYTYLHTEAFAHQRIRTWTENVSVINVQSVQHILERQNPLEYVYTCKLGQHYTCLDGTCILNLLICDNIDDCPDSSDEGAEMCHSLYCSDEVQCNRNCSEFHHLCDSGECVHFGHVCDSVFDCEDGSDELHCSIFTNGQAARDILEERRNSVLQVFFLLSCAQILNDLNKT